MCVRARACVCVHLSVLLWVCSLERTSFEFKACHTLCLRLVLLQHVCLIKQSSIHAIKRQIIKTMTTTWKQDTIGGILRRAAALIDSLHDELIPIRSHESHLVSSLLQTTQQ